jgi:hypothetical protein
METNTLPSLPISKSEDKKTYMREYKRKQYKEKSEEIKQKNKAYYYKYKFKISSEELHKYDTLLPNIVRLKKELDEIMKIRPELLKEILEPYLELK